MNTKQLTPAQQKNVAVGKAARNFRQTCEGIANSLLKDWVGEQKASLAIGRVSSALASAAASAKNPSDFYDCTPQSIGAVIAVSALTEIMVSTGRNALAYAIPRRPRKGETPQLRYELSHRGVAALARRAGQSLTAVPISSSDQLTVSPTGEVVVTERDIDNPPMTMEELRGVVIIVKDIATNSVLMSGFVAKKLIIKRMKTSDSYKFAEEPGNEWAKKSSPWHVWPIEQSMKTGMHYACSRGWCVIDDTAAIRAMSMDESPTVQGFVVSPSAQAAPIVNPVAPPKTLEDLTERMNESDSASDELKDSEAEPNAGNKEKEKPAQKKQGNKSGTKSSKKSASKKGDEKSDDMEDQQEPELDFESHFRAALSETKTKEEANKVNEDWYNRATTDEQREMCIEVGGMRIQELEENTEKKE